MWIEFNNNPLGKRVGDCSVRAVSKALDMEWEQAYALMSRMGYSMGDMPSSNAVWGAVLKRHGFYRFAMPNACPHCYTADDFCKDNPKGVYVLGFDGHVATVINGNLYDSFDSSNDVPQFFWYKGD